MYNVICKEGHSHVTEMNDASLPMLVDGSRSCIQFAPSQNVQKKSHRFICVKKFIFETKRCVLHDFMINMCQGLFIVYTEYQGSWSVLLVMWQLPRQHTNMHTSSTFGFCNSTPCMSVSYTQTTKLTSRGSEFFI